MPIQFLKSSRINVELENLIGQAESYLHLICPYIKLHSKLKDELKSRMHDPELQIIVVFGKNESNKERSLSKEDFEFFKQFPNIEIKYESKLHAKYYANDKYAIISSMNLYDYSQNNNIEVGILMTVKNAMLTSLANRVVTVDDPEMDAYKHFRKIINNADQLYFKIPNFEKSLFGTQGDYIDSTIIIDKLSETYQLTIPVKMEYKSLEKPLNAKPISPQILGYCIRTGMKIPFDLKKPYSDKAYNSWIKWSNEQYQEKYCHFSGEESNGNTCFAKPILGKNWKSAKRTFNF